MKMHLTFAVITIVLLAVVITARQQDAFSFDDLVELAKRTAREEYFPPAAAPDFLASLTYDEYRGIRWRDEHTLWRREGLPFQAQFFLPGHLFTHSVGIYEIHGPRVTPVAFSPDFFHSADLLEEEVDGELGYAGFRLHYPLNHSDALDEVAVFLGASYFRMLGQDATYGASARGLALGTGKRGEEFPAFTHFWLKKPAAFSRTFTLYALLDSPSVAGAYQFDIMPGAETRVAVRATLFFRGKGTDAGFAPLTSMYWFGENTSNTFGDFRPEVHDSDGLLMHRSSGEWVWHPLAWSQQLQVNVFADPRFQGFGLLQRDRDFNHYHDLEALYHKRPSVWVELVRGFDRGAVRLVQLPTNNEAMDNVTAFWTPNEPPPVLQPVELEYVLRWFQDAPELPPLGRCLSTRIDHQDAPDFRHFFLEFAGGEVGKRNHDNPPTMEVTALDGAEISEQQLGWNEFNNSWRASFIVSTSRKHMPVDLICRLKDGERPLTETWSYTWVP